MRSKAKALRYTLILSVVSTYLTMLGKAVSPHPASSVTSSRRPESVSSRQMPVPCCLREKLTKSAR